MIVVELFAQNAVEETVYAVAHSRIAGMKEGLADTIDQLHILQSGEGYLAQSLVKYCCGIAFTALCYEVFG